MLSSPRHTAGAGAGAAAEEQRRPLQSGFLKPTIPTSEAGKGQVQQGQMPPPQTPPAWGPPDWVRTCGLID